MRTFPKLSHFVLRSNAGEVIDKSWWHDGEEVLYTCAREPLPSSFGSFPPEKRTTTDDLLLTRNGTPYVHIPSEGAIYSNVVQRIALKEGCHRRYFWYVLQNAGDSLRGYGVSIESLNYEMWAALRLWVPLFAEQVRIANFLDDKTARIDALIAEKERLAEVLVAMKRDVIDSAVLGDRMGGGSQSLKGLEALGSITEGWALSRMKFELEYVTSGSRGWAEHYADDGALFVRIGNLTRDSIELNLSDVQRVALPNDAEGVRARVQPGDLLISITAYLGSVAVAPEDIEEAYVSQHVSLARPNRLRALPEWLGYVVLSSIGRTFFDLQAYGGTKVQLSLDDIRELPVPLPPKAVQRERIASLEARMHSLNELTAHVQEHIARLREYRSSLISAAVTGRLDVPIE